MSENISCLLNKGFEYLGGKSGNLLDCELILANVLGVEKEYLISHREDQIEGNLQNLFWLYLKRVKDGEPVAYILKEKEFYGLNFYVDHRVLVPRPETEILVDKILDYLKNSDNKKFKILDVGTGSGNIAIALASNFQNLEITAVDISEDALEVARLNVDQHGVEDRVELCQGDLLEMIDDGENFDIIVANLPYIGTETNSDVRKNVKKYEPGLALFSGIDGLELYKKMFQQIKDKRIGYDLIIGEIGSMQMRDAEEMLDKFFEQKWSLERDLAGLTRMFVIKKS